MFVFLFDYIKRKLVYQDLDTIKVVQKKLALASPDRFLEMQNAHLRPTESESAIESGLCKLNIFSDFF